VSENRSPDIVEAALNSGAGGYLVKSDAAGELLTAISAVLEGRRYVSASLSGDILVTPKTEAARAQGSTDHNPYLRFSKNPDISEFLEAVVDSTGADFGAVQLFDSTNHVLRIVAQHGFESEFLHYFNTVGLAIRSACNESMDERTRVIVKDVSTDPLFSNDLRGLLLRAKVRSIQSTPLIDSSGKLLGVVSTHYSHPGTPSPDGLKQVDNLAMSFLANLQARG
jgi:GAF domain